MQEVQEISPTLEGLVVDDDWRLIILGAPYVGQTGVFGINVIVP